MHFDFSVFATCRFFLHVTTWTNARFSLDFLQMSKQADVNNAKQQSPASKWGKAVRLWSVVICEMRSSSESDGETVFA